MAGRYPHNDIFQGKTNVALEYEDEQHKLASRHEARNQQLQHVNKKVADSPSIGLTESKWGSSSTSAKATFSKGAFPRSGSSSVPIKAPPVKTGTEECSTPQTVLKPTRQVSAFRIDSAEQKLGELKSDTLKSHPPKISIKGYQSPQTPVPSTAFENLRSYYKHQWRSDSNASNSSPQTKDSPKSDVNTCIYPKADTVHMSRADIEQPQSCNSATSISNLEQHLCRLSLSGNNSEPQQTIASPRPESEPPLANILVDYGSDSSDDERPKRESLPVSSCQPSPQVTKTSIQARPNMSTPLNENFKPGLAVTSKPVQLAKLASGMESSKYASLPKVAKQPLASAPVNQQKQLGNNRPPASANGMSIPSATSRVEYPASAAGLEGPSRLTPTEQMLAKYNSKSFPTGNGMVIAPSPQSTSSASNIISTARSTYKHADIKPDEASVPASSKLQQSGQSSGTPTVNKVYRQAKPAASSKVSTISLASNGKASPPAIKNLSDVKSKPAISSDANLKSSMTAQKAAARQDDFPKAPELGPFRPMPDPLFKAPPKPQPAAAPSSSNWGRAMAQPQMKKGFKGFKASASASADFKACIDSLTKIAAEDPDELDEGVVGGWGQGAPPEPRGPNENCRRVIIEGFDDTCKPSHVQAVTWGGFLEQIIYKDGDVKAEVIFILPGSARIYWNESTDGIRWGGITLRTSLSDIIDPPHPHMDKWLKMRASRCLTCYCPDSWTSQMLRTLGKGGKQNPRGQECCKIGPMDIERGHLTPVVRWRYTSVEECVRLFEQLQADKEWTDCPMWFDVDPCKMASGVHDVY